MTKIHCHICHEDFYINSNVEYICTHCPHCGWHHLNDTLYGHFDKPYMFPDCPHYNELTNKLNAIKDLNILTEEEFKRIQMTLEVTLQNPESGLGFAWDMINPEDICIQLKCKRAIHASSLPGMKKHKYLYSVCKNNCPHSIHEFIDKLNPYDLVRLY